MKNIKVNVRYKLFYALIMSLILIAYLAIYYYIEKDTTLLLYQAITWSCPYVFLYYAYILKNKIRIVEDKQLICKPSNSIYFETIDINKINRVEKQKGLLFTSVIVHYNEKDKVRLYPDDCTSFINTLNQNIA